MKRLIIATFALLGFLASAAQENKVQLEPDALLFKKVDEYEVEGSNHQWLSNPWKENWFILANAGVNAFWGDLTKGSLSTRLTPQFNIGFGKWFLPGIGVKFQFAGFESRAHKYIDGYFTHGSPTYHEGDGTPYWKEKHKWWDINVNAMFNISRLILGYEGRDSRHMMNQFILSLGLGAVHTTNLWDHGTQNEWSGHVELQYSRFFTRSKALALDVILRGMFYDTWWDQVRDHQHFDINASLNIGLTYYFKDRGWNKISKRYTYYYQDNMDKVNALQTEVNALRAQEMPNLTYKKMVFYIFYPNNYSGRDDAPVKARAEVNAIDYLAGGIFTQRRFDSDKEAQQYLSNGTKLRKLRTENVPTQQATFTSNPTGVARGYEMSTSPISLSMDPSALSSFESVAGYYYAPIYEGNKTWYYRVDNETRDQQLTSEDNYRETHSYQLNAHQGLELVRKNIPTDEDAKLYSFADMYAAINGQEGYIADYSDAQAVAEINDILNNAQLIDVQVEGLATSQDNYVGPNAESKRAVRNRNLSHYRAFTAVKWMKESGKFNSLQPNDYSINVLPAIIGTVDDASTRELNAKLNRCARVTVRYINK